MRQLTQIFLKKYRPTPVDKLANQMISFSLANAPGMQIIEAFEIN
jgi:hypothetical protein